MALSLSPTFVVRETAIVKRGDILDQSGIIHRALHHAGSRSRYFLEIEGRAVIGIERDRRGVVLQRADIVAFVTVSVAATNRKQRLGSIRTTSIKSLDRARVVLCRRVKNSSVEECTGLFCRSSRFNLLAVGLNGVLTISLPPYARPRL